MEWKCKSLDEEKNHLQDVYYQPPTKEVKVEATTVGQLRTWQCKGDVLSDPKAWDLELITKEKESPLPSYKLEKMDWIDASTFEVSLRFYSIEKKNWDFQLVKKEREDQTSNKKEETKKEAGKSEAQALKGISPNLTSVLDHLELKEEPPKSGEGESLPMQGAAQPKPYPAISGIQLSYPPLMWLIILLGFCILIAIGMRAYRKKQVLKKFRQEMAENAITKSPIHHFYKQLRHLYRFKGEDREYFDLLKTAYLGFLQYRFQIPTNNWKTEQIYKYLKKHHPELGEDLLRDTHSHLKEFQSLSEKEVKRKDVETFLMDLQNNVEALNKRAKEVAS